MKNKNELKKIVEKYNKIIKEYHDRVERDVFPKLENDRKKYDSILHKLKSFYFITNYISSHGNMVTKEEYENALFTIYNKAALDLFGIFHCLYNGLSIQAGIIYRSLYETHVYNDFIFKYDTKERIKLFYNFQFVERWNHIQDSLKNNPNYIEDVGLDQTSLEHYKKDYHRCIDDYNQKRPHHWAYKIFKDELKDRNPSLFHICKHLGEVYVKEYKSVYGTSSKQTHPSSIMGDYYTISERNRNVSINSPMYKDDIVNTSVLSMSYCGKIILDIIKYFNIDNLDELSLYIQTYIDITFDEGEKYL